MIDSPFGRSPEKAPRWDLMGTEGCGGGIRFLWCSSMVWGYVGIYRRKKYVGGSTCAPTRVEGVPVGVGTPPTLCLPGCFLDVGSKSPGSYLMRKSRSKRFHSVWTPFDIPFLRNTEIGKNNNSGLGLRLIG